MLKIYNITKLQISCLQKITATTKCRVFSLNNFPIFWSIVQISSAISCLIMPVNATAKSSMVNCISLPKKVNRNVLTRHVAKSREEKITINL